MAETFDSMQLFIVFAETGPVLCDSLQHFISYCRPANMCAENSQFDHSEMALIKPRNLTKVALKSNDVSKPAHYTSNNYVRPFLANADGPNLNTGSLMIILPQEIIGPREDIIMPSYGSALDLSKPILHHFIEYGIGDYYTKGKFFHLKIS